MNWNGQRPYIDHIIAKALDQDNAGRMQADFNAKRRAKVQSSLNTRPVYMNLQFNMTAAGQTSPYRATTPSLAYDVQIIGFKADSQTRNINFRRTEDNKPLVFVGDETNLFLRVDDVAGQSATTGGGQLGTFYLPSPINLPRNTRLTIEMFKTDVTADVEQANITLIGFRVFSRAYANEMLDGDEKKRIEFAIQARDVPEVKFLKQLVTFDSAIAGGQARNLLTPEVEEPLLLRGVRTTLRQSTIELQIQGEPMWMPSAVPIWAVAGEDELVHDNYNWFPKPIYLHSKNQIEILRIINSIDNVLIDAQTGNTITWICETV